MPGSIYSEKSIGCHNLIRDGAVLIRSADDILEFYDWAKNNSVDKNISDKKNIDNETFKLEGVEKKVFDAIPSGDFISTDEILMKVDDISFSEFSNAIIQLDLKNCIVEQDGEYSRKI